MIQVVEAQNEFEAKDYLIRNYPVKKIIEVRVQKEKTGNNFKIKFLPKEKDGKCDICKDDIFGKAIYYKAKKLCQYHYDRIKREELNKGKKYKRW